MSVTSGSDEKTVGNGVDSSSVDDANSGGRIVGVNGPLKKGPWTPAEDAILVEYVSKHGEGNWNAVQKHSGLARCGKSCRLRWANHLRPDLKKGAFTLEEERRIIELHAKMGNKWARMATELPGRTDNEIKNYWNTRIKRQMRAGQPIYPPDICMEAMEAEAEATNENQVNQPIDGPSAFSSPDMTHPEFIAMNSFVIPTVEFKTLELDRPIYEPPMTSVVEFKTLELDRPIYEPPMTSIPTGNLLADGFNSSNVNWPFLSAAQPSCKRLRGCEPLFPSLEGGSTSPLQMAIPGNFSTSGLLDSSHAVLNGNPSSEPQNWAMTQELPSLQTEMSSWCSRRPSSPMPSFESVDSLIQTPPADELCNLPPQNSGLLDAALGPGPYAAYDLNETNWKAYEDELSPLGHSTSSVFSESTPVSGNSFDEPVTFPGNRICARPDFLLDSSCDASDEDDSLKDVVGMFLVDDCRPEMETQSSSHCDANLWNAMSTTTR